MTESRIFIPRSRMVVPSGGAAVISSRTFFELPDAFEQVRHHNLVALHVAQIGRRQFVRDFQAMIHN